MPQMLNLDEVAAKTERVLSIRGEQYEMQPMSVSDFIDYTSKVQAQEVKGKKKGKAEPDKSIIEIMESLIEMITKSFPTLPEEIVRTLTLEQLNAIIEFARGDSDLKEGEEEKK